MLIYIHLDCFGACIFVGAVIMGVGGVVAMVPSRNLSNKGPNSNCPKNCSTARGMKALLLFRISPVNSSPVRVIPADLSE